MRVAVDVHQHSPAGPDDPRQLGDALRHVLEQHHAELRSGDVEAAVLQLERVAVHHPRLDAQLLLAGALLEQREHRRGEVRREHVRAEARGGDAEGAAAGGDVEEAQARAEPGAAEALVAEPHLRGGVGPVVAGGDRVPGGHDSSSRNASDCSTCGTWPASSMTCSGQPSRALAASARPSGTKRSCRPHSSVAGISMRSSASGTCFVPAPISRASCA